MLTLVVNNKAMDTDDGPSELEKLHALMAEDPNFDLLHYDLSKIPEFNITGRIKQRVEELKAMVRRELILMDNAKNLSEGKRRLYDKVAEAFQIFIDAEDVNEATDEQQSISYYVLLYYVDKFYPGVQIELSEDNQINLLYEGKDKEDNAYLLRYLIRSWNTLTTFQTMTINDVIVGLFPGF